MINVDVHAKIKKNIMCAKKFIFLNPAACSRENGKYLGSIIDDLTVISDKIIDTKKTVPTTTVSTKSTSTNFCINHHNIIDMC